MTLTILASVSLLALISSARPLPKPDEHWKGLQLSEPGTTTDIQHAIQAVVKSHASTTENLDDEDDVQVHLASVDEVQAYLSSAEDDAVKVLIPLNEEELHSPDEKELYEILNRLEIERERESPVPDDVLDTMSIDSPSSVSSVVELPVDAPVVSQMELPISKSVVVIIVSCVVAFVALCCVAASVYIVEVLRKSILQSREVWRILPKLEKNVVEQSDQTRGVSHVSLESDTQGSEKLSGALTIPTHLLRMPSRSSLCEPKCENTSADRADFGDDIDEKFFDAESSDAESLDSRYATPIVSPIDLPPGLPALAAAAATVAAVAVVANSAPEMSGASAPATRPSWSVRATEAKLPTVEPSSAAVLHAGGTREGRRRAFAAIPELDVALAMQLRPGLGVGADAAWLVRFVMALFGWCAVLMSGGARRR